MSVERVNIKLATTNGRIAIDAFSEVNRLAGDKYTVPLRYVDHRSSLKKCAKQFFKAIGANVNLHQHTIRPIELHNRCRRCKGLSRFISQGMLCNLTKIECFLRFSRCLGVFLTCSRSASAR